ncbi:MAG: carbohydrate binding family 9 domain-containing protein [Pseudomonadota bacterium]|nr:carbohydrate binding family 9 domain-containing protein [Pseudomonadota bacterium]
MKKELWVAALLGMLAGSPPARAIEALSLAPGEKIVPDGRLDEPAWDRAPLLDRFWEVFPQAEVEARVRTEARYAYDHQALYVAVRSWDPDPAQLRAPFARRDKVLADQDMIVLFIDPVGNRKFAHFFRVNPRGAVGDGLYNEDSGAEDFSPDFEFEVATGRFEGGWTAEFRIPFSSLRYGEPPSKQWTTMVFRNYPREERYRISTSKLPRDQNCFICLNEPLTGLDRLPDARHLALTPDVTVRSVTTRDGGPSRREAEIVPSLDLKWRPRADIVVDATLNPDFSQVELDTPQLSGNAQFALFFPEKRPFFLEGADILEAPFRAIYTRSVTDPAWGVRATQRSGRFDGTVLVTRDDGGGLVLLPNTYGTGFAPQDFKSVASFVRGRWQAGGATVG